MTMPNGDRSRSERMGLAAYTAYSKDWHFVTDRPAEKRWEELSPGQRATWKRVARAVLGASATPPRGGDEI